MRRGNVRQQLKTICHNCIQMNYIKILIHDNTWYSLLQYIIVVLVTGMCILQQKRFKSLWPIEGRNADLHRVCPRGRRMLHLSSSCNREHPWTWVVCGMCGMCGMCGKCKLVCLATLLLERPRVIVHGWPKCRKNMPIMSLQCLHHCLELFWINASHISWFEPWSRFSQETIL